MNQEDLKQAKYCGLCGKDSCNCAMPSQPNSKEETKLCSKCEVAVPISRFFGKRTWCRDCSNTNRKEKDNGLFARFYSIYSRCKYKTKGNTSRKYYVDKGIKCEWETYQQFKDDMYESYLEHLGKHGKSNTTIDRINSNGNYCKENCRWATRKEQEANKKNQKCNGAHCKCMDIGGQCPNKHYYNCKEHNPNATPTHTSDEWEKELQKVIRGALKSCIDAHGKIEIPSAEKRLIRPVYNFLSTAIKTREEENNLYRKVAYLITSIFYYGNFKAETPNEKELEKLLRELNLWPTNEEIIINRLS